MKETRAIPPDIRAAARKVRMSPLDYMLAVMNDETAERERRDRMAIAAAPYVHPRKADAPGKKQEAEAAAKTAERGTNWETLLQ
ncbi:MAG TPA: hypothetical protein VF151_08510 [Gemmatimonadales bacterium]